MRTRAERRVRAPGLQDESTKRHVGPVPSPGDVPSRPNAGSGDPAYKMSASPRPVGPVPSPGDVPTRPDAGSGDPAYKMKGDKERIPLCPRRKLPLATADSQAENPALMNRIVDRFDRLRREKRKGFIVYIGSGDPDLEATRELGLGFDKLGVDVLELGVPFSDPLADGLVNQLAAQRGLESGTTPPKVLETVATIRKQSQIPIVLYIYFNLIHRRGLERFIGDAARAGVDGLLALDLPPEEGRAYEAAMAKAGLCNIYLVAPTTPEERMGSIVKRGRGFIYYVSREGVTGMQERVAESIAEMTGKIRAHTDLPIAVGFGISNPEQARMVAGCADAVVVGSAIVNQIAKHGKGSGLAKHVMEFTQPLIAAVH